ncbi:MAG: hypothetical protein KF862_21090 [Chitinophagaceae bacterium]|nr:hypothetical protein [Chitinophagaceae bacterium]
MSYTVFFREENEIFSAAGYISQQLEAHRAILQSMSDELAVNGYLKDSPATKAANGDWWVLLKDGDGGLYSYSFFISRFEQQAADNKAEKSVQQKELVIIDPAGPKDSVGGYHPGYWTISHYASLLEENEKKLFLETVDQIRDNLSSPYYTFNSDGSVSIHIHKPAKAYTIFMECRAEWK